MHSYILSSSLPFTIWLALNCIVTVRIPYAPGPNTTTASLMKMTMDVQNVEASVLFKPLKLGRLTLSHRIAMAPMTRRRNDEEHNILDIAATYYGERACEPGTLLITESINPSAWASGSEGPHICTNDQVAALKLVADAVHARGSYIFIQLMANGRTADQDVRNEEITGPVLSSSAIPMPAEKRVGQGLYLKPSSVPKAMTEEEIARMIKEFADAARRAVDVAGFDGVEVHGGHGFLIDQFTQDTCNQRTDRWGGSIENRSRFAVEVTKAVAAAIGPDRTGIRLSPWNTFRGMGMKDPIPQFSNLIEQLQPLGLAYLHLVDASETGDSNISHSDRVQNYPLIEKWQGSNSPIIVSGGQDGETAKRTVDVDHVDRDVIVAMGKNFLSTPDLIFRLKRGIALNSPEKSFFYRPAGPQGYTDYACSEEWISEQQTNKFRDGEAPRYHQESVPTI